MENKHWSDILLLAKERTRIYANLIAEGIEPETALNNVYGKMMATKIRTDLQELEHKYTKPNHIPEDGC